MSEHLPTFTIAHLPCKAGPSTKVSSKASDVLRRNNLLLEAEPSASSFPRNERDRATGTATDVDPVSACCGQFLEIDAIFTSLAPAGDPVQGPDNDRPARSIRSGVRAYCRLQRHRPQRTQHRRRGEMRCELESCRPRIGQFRHPALAWAQETATEAQGKRRVACASLELLFPSFASHDLAGASTTRSTTPQTAIAATYNSSLDLIMDLLRRYSPSRPEKLSAHHSSPGSSR
ncbi:uncharacterized protein BDZ83DRAFT_144575 [Colletotrichum acutatum]|uniref:Uncharacterized protein n=1 Tax=Glomerella acutata TaxID=27357 RepID=A0AAD8X8P2_GLOAC|nr:uncharacterized protein BDZ83DRAFT_144575 [Colletotrichum acutatum]KAK1709420.1 hypothetical protein BDZ83DRAFT_144575 [Colletotrichum acutatum]